MSVSRDEIVAAFRFILSREPTEADVDYHVGLGFSNVAELSTYFTCTDEFRRRYDRFIAEGRAPASEFDKDRGLTRPATIFLGDRVLAHTHQRLKIYLPPTDVDLAPHIMFGGKWEAHVETAISRLLRPGARVADIGANIGYHTLHMAVSVGAGGEVHAFEANPELLPLLTATFFVNGVKPWVHIHACAAMDKPGFITLAAEPNHYGSGNAVPDGYDNAAGYHSAYSVKHQVKAVTLDDVFGPAIAPFDLLRLDIEGSEPLALRGGSRLINSSPDLCIIAEWSIGMMSARTNVAEFVDWLSGQGFHFWLIRPENGAFEFVAPHNTLNLPHSDLAISRRALT